MTRKTGVFIIRNANRAIIIKLLEKGEGPKKIDLDLETRNDLD